jgi:pyruvate,water dikinase
MAVLASQTEGLAAELMERGGREFFESERMEAFPAFSERFNRFIEDHGHREVDMDYRVPTWSGQPWVVLDSVVLLLRVPAGLSPADAMRAQRLRYAQTQEQFLARVPEALRFFFRELINLTRTYTVLDDLEHYQTTRANPLARRAALVMGRMLKAIGALDDPDDVFFLNKTDLDALIGETNGDLIAKTLDKSRAAKASYDASSNSTPPWARRQSGAAEGAKSGNVLRGLPGSQGRAAGPCFRVRGPEDFGRFPDRAVLVARTTNPAWTSLFYAAAAVVTESGGPLSHGAVTAREMGLPAVMSVRGIMTLVKEGQNLVVDGSAGTVEVGEQ